MDFLCTCTICQKWIDLNDKDNKKDSDGDIICSSCNTGEQEQFAQTTR